MVVIDVYPGGGTRTPPLRISPNPTPPLRSQPNATKGGAKRRRTLSAQSSGRSWPRPEDARRRTLYNDFSQSSPKGRAREPWRTGGLASTRVNRRVGQTDMQRDCGVSWRYQAWVLKNSLTRNCSKNLRNRKPYNPRSLFWWTFSIPKISAILRERGFSTATMRHLLLLVQHSGWVQSFPRALGSA